MLRKLLLSFLNGVLVMLTVVVGVVVAHSNQLWFVALAERLGLPGLLQPRFPLPPSESMIYDLISFRSAIHRPHARIDGFCNSTHLCCTIALVRSVSTWTSMQTLKP